MHLALLLALAAALPGFEQFQQADRERRETGKWETVASSALARIHEAQVLAVATNQPGDALLQWGAAELLNDWTNRQARFETALAASGSNAVIALRYAAAAAKQARYDAALNLLKFCQTQDPSNAVPWVIEAWTHQQRDQDGKTIRPPPAAIVFADGAALAARARIKVLETIGYSPYAARRLGYNPELTVLPMARDIARTPAVPPEWLRAVAVSMQQAPTFLVTELVGQSLENMLGASADRVADLKDRREDVLELTRTVGLHVVGRATESELIRYYDDLLARGEEQALNRLKKAVEAGRTPP